MKRYTKGRDRVIDYIGLRGGFPVLNQTSGEPAILRPDDDETQYRRVGWPEFFAAVEARDYVFVYDDESPDLDYQFLPRARARKELGLGRTYWAKHTLEVLRGLPVVQH